MNKSISLILPAKNESVSIKKTILDYYNSLNQRKEKFQIIVVVNNSTDNTARIVKDLAKTKKRITLIEKKERIGKGGAVELGIKEAQSEIVGFVDSDGSFSSRDVLRVISEIKNSKVTCVAGIKKYKSLKRGLLSKGFSALTLLFVGFSDTQTGLKFFRKKEIQKYFPLKEKEWLFDAELLKKIKMDGKEIKFIEVEIKENNKSNISTKDIFKMLFGVIKLGFLK